MSKQKIETTIPGQGSKLAEAPRKATREAKTAPERRYTVKYETAGMTGARWPTSQHLTVTEMQRLLEQTLTGNAELAVKFNKLYHEAQTTATQLADAQHELEQLKAKVAQMEGARDAYLDALKTIMASVLPVTVHIPRITHTHTGGKS